MWGRGRAVQSWPVSSSVRPWFWLRPIRDYWYLSRAFNACARNLGTGGIEDYQHLVFSPMTVRRVFLLDHTHDDPLGPPSRPLLRLSTFLLKRILSGIDPLSVWISMIPRLRRGEADSAPSAARMLVKLLWRRAKTKGLAPCCAIGA